MYDMRTNSEQRNAKNTMGRGFIPDVGRGRWLFGLNRVSMPARNSHNSIIGSSQHVFGPERRGAMGLQRAASAMVELNPPAQVKAGNFDTLPLIFQGVIMFRSLMFLLHRHSRPAKIGRPLASRSVGDDSV